MQYSYAIEWMLPGEQQVRDISSSIALFPLANAQS